MQRLWNWEEKEKKKTIDLEKNIKFMETNVETKCCKFIERPNTYVHIS